MGLIEVEGQLFAQKYLSNHCASKKPQQTKNISIHDEDDDLLSTANKQISSDTVNNINIPQLEHHHIEHSEDIDSNPLDIRVPNIPYIVMPIQSNDKSEMPPIEQIENKENSVSMSDVSICNVSNNMDMDHEHNMNVLTSNMSQITTSNDDNNGTQTASNRDAVHRKTVGAIRTIQLKKRASELNDIETKHKNRNQRKRQTKNNRNLSERTREQKTIKIRKRERRSYEVKTVNLCWRIK